VVNSLRMQVDLGLVELSVPHVTTVMMPRGHGLDMMTPPWGS
jgi:hypothetical protein